TAARQGHRVQWSHTGSGKLGNSPDDARTPEPLDRECHGARPASFSASLISLDTRDLCCLSLSTRALTRAREAVHNRGLFADLFGSQSWADARNARLHATEAEGKSNLYPRRERRTDRAAHPHKKPEHFAAVLGPRPGRVF